MILLWSAYIYDPFMMAICCFLFVFRCYAPLELSQAGNTRVGILRYYFRGNSMSKRSSSLVVAVPFDVVPLVLLGLFSINTATRLFSLIVFFSVPLGRKRQCFCLFCSVCT